jgi:hypothetical protein
VLSRLPATAVAMALAWAMSLFSALGDLPRFPRHEQQLFLAEHYQRSWWNALDARWYGGFDVTTHPGGVAQLVALVSRLPGLALERAYAIMAAGAALLVALGMTWLARALGGGRGWWAVTAVALPPLWLALVPWGEVAAVAAVGLALVALAASLEPAANPVFGLSAALAAGAAVICHPIALAVLPASLLAPRRAGATFVGLALGVAASWAFLTQWLSFARPPAHLAEALWACVAASVLVAARSFATQQVRPGAIALLGALVSLGALTRPPFITAAACLLASTALTAAAVAGCEKKPSRWAVVATMAALVTTAGFLGQASQVDLRPSRAALKEVEALLRRPSEAQVRWLTLGIGPEWLELSRRLAPSSIDGGFEWLRPSLDLLSNDEEGLARLSQALEPSNSVKWVVSRDGRFDTSLTKHAFRVVSAWRGGVRLWVRDDTPAVQVGATRTLGLSFGFAALGPCIAILGLLASVIASLTRPPIVSHKLADTGNRQA